MNLSKLKKCQGCNIIFQYNENVIIPNFGMIRYGVASSECQATFNEILAKERVLYGYPPAHRLIVDAYAVQHPPS